MGVHRAGVLNPTAEKLHISPTLEINELVNKHEKEGHKIVHLGFGEATFPVPKAVLQTHQETSSDTNYLPVCGLLKLREVRGSSYTYSHSWE